MITFQHVEDYVQFIAGTRDLNNRTTSYWMAQSPVSLARYDKSVVSSFAEQIERSVAFTDRQSQLAQRLVEKYRRQLHKLGVVVNDDINSIPFRYTIRQVDRTRRAYIKEDTLVLQFPYNTEMINMIKEYAKTSPGTIAYSHDNKYWTVALTEGCVNWAVAFAKAFEFDVADNVASIFDKIIQAEDVEYKIELCRLDGQLTITNATDSLLEYIDKHVGGLCEENLNKLLDMASELGYSIGDDLLADAEYSQFLSAKSIQVIPNEGELEKIVGYAKAYNKFPIVSYSPNNLGAHDIVNLNELFSADEILHLNTLHKSQDVATDSTRLIHMGTKAAKEYAGEVPMLICYGNISFGSVNSLLFQRASKIFFYCNPILKVN